MTLNSRVLRTASRFGIAAAVLFSAACAEPSRLVSNATDGDVAIAAKGKRALSGNVTFTGITMETRYWNSAGPMPTAATASATFNALPTNVAGYSNAPIGLPTLARTIVQVNVDPVSGFPDTVWAATRNPGGAINNIGTRFRISLNSAGPSSIGFRMGVDAKGVVILLDGTPIAQNFNDLVWYGYWLMDISDTETPQWVTSDQVVEIVPVNLSAGSHVIEVLGFEDGNDFGWGAQFDVGTGWQDVVAPVPNVPVTVTKNGGGTGTVVSAPVGINCGATCTFGYPYGTVVTLTAAGTAPSIFAGWSGACTGVTGACVVTATTAKTVGAKFTGTASVTGMTVESRYWNRNSTQPTAATAVSLFNSLPTNVAGYTNAPVSVTGPVTNASLFTAPSIGANTDIATRTVATMVSAGTSEVQLRADVDFSSGGALLVDGVMVNSLFGPIAPGSWSLNATVTLTPGTHTITMLGFEDCCDGGSRFQYNYALGFTDFTAPLPAPQPLTVNIGAGGGVVTSSPAGINCGAACTASFPAGGQVFLTAAPLPGYQFTGWSGACSGTSTSCVVRTQVATFVTATFVKPVLTVTKSGTGGGTVTSSPAGINCGTLCSAAFNDGASVTLTAVPAPGSAFIGWSGACTGTAPCTLTMATARAVGAEFKRTQVGDTEPPTVSCQATPSVLWPPNHKMVDIKLSVSLSDLGSGPAGFKLLSVTSNEPDDAQSGKGDDDDDDDKGDGHTVNDIQGWLLGTADVTGQLRAERAGGGKGRIYTFTYQGTDGAGNTATSSCTVTVPHDKR